MLKAIDDENDISIPKLRKYIMICIYVFNYLTAFSSTFLSDDLKYTFEAVQMVQTKNSTKILLTWTETIHI